LKKPSAKTIHKISATKRLASRSKIAEERHVPGLHTLRETLSQPALWAETFAQLDSAKTVDRLAAHFSAEEPWLFVACGSSYYLAQLVCTIWSRNFSIRCAAVPASEFLFAPEATLRSSGAKQIIFISRSGETTEVLRAAELLKDRVDVRTLGVTCNAASRLDELCTHMSTLPWADEKSTVMTRSFTSILLFFQLLGDRISSGNAQLSATLKELPAVTQPWLDANADRIRKFVAKRKFADFVFLGQGAHYWLAQEAALKITEMSASYAQAYHTLEFRHGPRSIAGPQTLITFFLSDAANAEESLLVQELNALKAATVVVVNHATPVLEASSDLLIELNTSLPEFARFAVTAIPAHLLGTEVGLRKRLDPDAPKNLTRAVVLGAPQKNSHAAPQLHSSGKMRANQ
jgi:glucosamine--fructose-6-phosphate aminotransferase (isomerizing)